LFNILYLLEKLLFLLCLEVFNKLLLVL